MANVNGTCPELSLATSLSSVKKICGQYLIPPLFIIGLTGNMLNLLVLNSKGMRTNTNALLSLMAFADLCFFICFMPMELISFEFCRKSLIYMEFFIKTRMPLTAMTNFFSTASTWVAVVVTAERVCAIKMPLHAKFYWKRWRIVATVVSIFVFSFLLSCHFFFWMYPKKVSYCNDTVSFYELRAINESVSPILHKYVQISLLISPFIVVCAPMVALISFNSALLFYLHVNRKKMAEATNTFQMKGNEQKVAFMVAVIILSFIVLASPSAVLFIYDWVAVYVYKRPRTTTFVQAATISNLLVVVSKASNFMLYCSASSHFRRRLLALFCKGHVNIRSGGSSRYSTQRKTTLTSLLGRTEPSGPAWLLYKLRKISAGTNVSTNHDVQQMHALLDPLRRKSSDCLLYKSRRYSDPLNKSKKTLSSKRVVERRYSHPNRMT